MFSTADTIVAVATPPGRGGLGVVRISGPDASRIAGALVARQSPFVARHATFCRLPFSSSGSESSATTDQVIVTLFPAPRSYTGDDVAEISAHGSPVVLAAIVRAAVDAGARLAEPGEFTLRAFVNGKIDLVQAEAVADLIEAVTPLQARAACDQLEGTLTVAIGSIESELFDVMAKLEASLDFPDEGYHFLGTGEGRDSVARVIARIDDLLGQAVRGRLVREGAQVAIVGAPNVGKSSLFNRLLNANRAIVTAVPGTTRDLLTERAEICGLSLALIDTAGVRETSDVVEQEGVARTREALRVADLILVLLDRSRPVGEEDRAVLAETSGRRRLVVANKIDLASAADGWWAAAADPFAETSVEPVIEISVQSGQGLDELVSAISRALAAGEVLRDCPAITNVRHATLLGRARASLMNAAAVIEQAAPEEIVLIDLQDAAQALQEITGRRTTDDLLRHIFERFCIGK